ncbi:MAG: hypothetical protein N3B10_00680 [Armatimonadetes bacterium]|nr:hypothetical protein [Armatimonadota bacterium]MCX7966983.1 hypothetical protein [Armatimonadota bacterium]MDW8142140.1 hypothetical protein [Armatimonadota bacterium]
MLPTISEESLKMLAYWIGAICTLGIYTILYRENRVYRFLEHFYIGLALGFGLVETVNKVLDPQWFRPMVTETSVTVANFDKPPQLKGVEIDKVLKRVGEGSWKWDPSESRQIRLVGIPPDWGAPNYLKLWLHIDRPVAQGQIKLTMLIHNPDTSKKASLSTDIATDFSGWRELRLELRDFLAQGEPFREFERVGKYRVLGDVIAVEFEANNALEKSGAKVHLDELRHCIGYRWWWAFALVIGLMYYTVLSPRFGWMSRLSLSFLMSLSAAGYTFKAFAIEVPPQIKDSFRPIFGTDFATALNNAVFVIVLLCVMVYFFFSVEHRHILIRGPASLGRWLLMLTFGIVFGNTVMGRFSLFISRLDFLMLQNPVEAEKWAKLGMVVGLAVVLFLLAFLSVEYERRRTQRTET